MAKNNIVTIVCNGKSEQMKRGDAIRFFLDGFLACEGSERDRYGKILNDLYFGKSVCTDTDDGILAGF